jgi:hypothetical protein
MKLIELKFNFEESSLPNPGRTPDRAGPVRPSQAQSNLVKPNPTTPPPPGKQIGQETVKFLATFDHLDGPRFRLALPIRKVTILE